MFVIYNNMSKSRSDIVTLDLFRNRTIVTVKEGEFLEVVIGTLYPIGEAPALPQTGILPEGTYKVGVEIPAAIYTLRSTSDQYQGHYVVSTSSRHNAADVIKDERFDDLAFVVVHDGQYITLKFAELLL
jgi:hypothetical protein